MENFYPEPSSVTWTRTAALVVSLIDAFILYGVCYLAYTVRSFSAGGLADSSLLLLAMTVPHAAVLGPALSGAFSKHINTGTQRLAIYAVIFALAADIAALVFRLTGLVTDTGSAFIILMEVINVVWIVLDVLHIFFFLPLIRSISRWVNRMNWAMLSSMGSNAAVERMHKVKRTVSWARSFFRFAYFIQIYVILGLSFVMALGMLPAPFLSIFWTNVLLLTLWGFFYTAGGSLRFPPPDASNSTAFFIVTGILTSIDLGMCIGGFLYRIVKILSTDFDVLQQVGGWITIALVLILVFVDIAALAALNTIMSYVEVRRVKLAVGMAPHVAYYIKYVKGQGEEVGKTD